MQRTAESLKSNDGERKGILIAPSKLPGFSLHSIPFSISGRVRPHPGLRGSGTRGVEDCGMHLTPETFVGHIQIFYWYIYGHYGSLMSLLRCRSRTVSTRG